MGSLVTDFSLIRPGALHLANGGYLLIDAQRILGEPYAWDALKAAEVLERIDRSRVAAIVVDLTVGPFTSEEDLRHLFSAARCPVVVIGATRIKRSSAQTDAPRI
ncbi:AAA family ATPase [Ruegeria pomeroyi]|nr:AAA family ATPase [Ruegeria pomeroyi]